jgi:hypothetical protein
MCLAWLLWLLDARDPPPARTSAGVPSPGAGRHSATEPAASRTRVGPGPGACPDPSAAARRFARRGWPRSPSAAYQNRRSGFGGIVCCYFSDSEHLVLPEPGPQFREGRGQFSALAPVGFLVPRVAFHSRNRDSAEARIPRNVMAKSTARLITRLSGPGSGSTMASAQPLRGPITMRGQASEVLARVSRLLGRPCRQIVNPGRPGERLRGRIAAGEQARKRIAARSQGVGRDAGSARRLSSPRRLRSGLTAFFRERGQAE